MVWCEPTNHVSEYYYCMTKKKKSAIMCPDCPSALDSVLHDAKNPVSIPHQRFQTPKMMTVEIRISVMLKTKKVLLMKKN